jgi:predicted hotdog family 3-hydroxylacyl-ACP dehydratase
MTMTEFQPIEAFLPHRGAMLLLHRLVAADEEHAVAEVDVPLDGPFAREGGTPAWVGLEYMAQTIAAWSGARAGRLPRVGYLLGSRCYKVTRAMFPAGSTLRVEVRREFLDNNGFGLFDCRILLGSDPLASALVSVFEPTDTAEGSL